MSSSRGRDDPALNLDLRGAINDFERRADTNVKVSKERVDYHFEEIEQRLKPVEEQLRRMEAPISEPVLPPAPVEVLEPPPETEPSDEPDIEHDPRREYADFIARMQIYLDCLGIHTWSLCSATRANLGACMAICYMIPSILLLLFQCLILVGLGLTCLHPPCSRNEDCRAGMWCSPSKSLGLYYITPGMCDDCRWASSLDVTNRPSRYTSLDISWPQEAASTHCKDTDTDDARCDYLVFFQRQLTVGPFLVLLLVVGMVLLTMVIDMDKQGQLAHIFEHRINKHGTHSAMVQYVIRVLGWLIFAIRKFILPGIVTFAFASFALVSPLVPGMSLSMSFVLDGLTVTFMYNIDSLLAHALLDEEARTRVREAFVDMEVQGRERSRHYAHTEWLQHLFHGFLAAFSGGLILVEVLAVETMMKNLSLFRLDWDQLPGVWTENPGTLTCTNIPTTLAGATLILSLFLSFVWATSNFDFRNGSTVGLGLLDVIFSPIITLIGLPSLALLLLHVQYFPISE